MNVIGSRAGDILIGDAANTNTDDNRLERRGGNDTLTAIAGGSVINGGRGNDAIYGGAGNDEIYGGEDKDTINGGPGDDWLDGGPGADTFVFEPGNGNDYIMDFTSGDMIDLSAFDNADGTDFYSSAPGAAVGDNWVINLPEAFGGGSITILGVTSLSDGDFMF